MYNAFFFFLFVRIEITGSCERRRAHGSTRLGREETKGRKGLLAGDKAHQYRNISLTVHFTCVGDTNSPLYF